jgi:hypothetical protein
MIIREYFMKNKIYLQSIQGIAGIIALVAIIGFSMAACGDGSGGGDNPPPTDPVVLTMNFTENTGWNEAGHEDWCRWHYKYTGANTKTLDSTKTYVLTGSFTSNVNIDKLTVVFIKEDGWVEVSDYTDIHIPGPITKNARYNFKIPLFPKSNASDLLYVMIGNRENNTNNSTAPVLSFYEFSLEPVNKETAGLAKWTVSGKDINVTDTRRTFAENLGSYQGKNNVFHIKPTYNASTYDHIVMEYDLSAYSGKKIGVEMSFDAWINKEARIAWQMLISPDYPLVCGYLDSTYFLSANTWQTISGNTIVSVPNSGGKLYLSGMQINGAQAYFANATLVITEGSSTPDTAVTLNSVTADGSASSKTTQLTLTFSQAITGLNAANINLGSEISGLTKGTLSGSGPTYTLPVTGFTTGGTLTVSASKLGYNITPSKTVTIYGGSGSGGGGNDGGPFSNLDELKNWLNGKGNNTKDNPYNIKLNFPNLTGLLDYLKGLTGKFFNLDFSGSNMTGIGADAFKGLTNLIRITLPSGINNIGANAFNGCTNLISVTFKGTIPSGSFDTNAFSGLGDLRDKYLAGGAGTYTRQSGGTTWTKQGGGGTDIAAFAGTWNASGNRSIVFSGNTFTYKVNGTTTYSGTFSVSGSTITFNETNLETAETGNFSLSGNTLTLDVGFGVYGTYTKDGSSGGNGGGGDTMTWTIVDVSSIFGSMSEAANVAGIAYSGSRFVAVAGTGKMAYSDNGITWTEVSDSKFGTSDIYAIAYGGGKFVAVGRSGKIAYSDNGTTWTAVADSKFGTTEIIYTITYDDTGFVVGGANGKVAFSSDGITWYAGGDSTFGTNTIRAIASKGVKKVVVGNGGKIAYSSNATYWTAVGDSKFGTGTIYGVACSPYRFVAVGLTKYAYSTDGETWTALDLDFLGFEGIAYVNNKFIAWGGNTYIGTSPDGLTWASAGRVISNENTAYVYCVAWGSNKYVAGLSKGRIAYSTGN